MKINWKSLDRMAMGLLHLDGHLRTLPAQFEPEPDLAAESAARVSQPEPSHETKPCSCGAASA